MNRMNVKEWQIAYNEGAFESNDVQTQCKAGWYDWFCKDTSLANKTKRMGQIINQLKEGGKIDLENWYVWFKNNCPVNDPLYDDFRFSELETGNVQFTIDINCCWSEFKFSVYSIKNFMKKPIFETDSPKILVKWLNTPWKGGEE